MKYPSNPMKIAPNPVIVAMIVSLNASPTSALAGLLLMSYAAIAVITATATMASIIIVMANGKWLWLRHLPYRSHITVCDTLPKHREELGTEDNETYDTHEHTYNDKCKNGHRPR
jgi:ABC-type nickel/cobalt efflux system permease component RcnA